MPDLAILPAEPPTLAGSYAELRAGRVDMRKPAGQAAFGLALLRLGAPA